MPTSLDPFISRDDLGEYLGRDVSEDEGALAAVDAACDICRTLAEQTFNQVLGDTIRLDGSGGDALVLPELPVRNAGTVALGGTATSGTISGGTAVTNYVVDGDGILLRTAGAALPEDGSVPITWPRGRRNVAVTYDHGYAPNELPRDIRFVALEIASRLIVQGPAASENVGDVAVKYSVAATDLTAGERAIIAKYRRTR
jgi:hypothetical protein